MILDAPPPPRSPRRWSWSLRLCCLAFIVIAGGLAYLAERRREYLQEEAIWKELQLHARWRYGGWDGPTRDALWRWFDRVEAIDLARSGADFSYREGDEADRGVAKLVVFRELRMLSVRGEGLIFSTGPPPSYTITNRALEHISRFPRLERLDISIQPHVTADGIRHLAAAPSLELLIMDGTDYRATGQRELLRLRPDIVISSATIGFGLSSEPPVPAWFFEEKAPPLSWP